MTARRHIDLSHVVERGMVTYQGLPAPKISDSLSREAGRSRYAAGTEFQIGLIEMCSNTGTYLDTPFHRYADGVDLGGLDLDRVADIPAVTVDATGAGRSIGRDALVSPDVAGKAVLIRTGWDRHWRTDAYFIGHPFLTVDAARHLVERRHHRRRAAGAHDAPCGRHPDLRAPHEPRGAARRRLSVHRGPGKGGRHGHLPRPRLRHARYLD